MTKNLTIRIDEKILIQARKEAVEEQKSLAQWLIGLMTERLTRKADHRKAKDRALHHLGKGYHLGGKPLKREEMYDRTGMFR
ncbi:MAG: hypothetical protein HY591_02360 [Candidatus Omnitrophica bacterium]|nr:hypothetical protein [Candidatus Omnitrophota bacterium]